MIPAGITGKVVEQLAELMERRRHHHRRRQLATTARTSTAPRRCEPKGIHYVDVGTSGGVFGLERGYCLMIGGEDDVVAHLDPLLQVDRARRRRGRRARRAAPASRRREEQGYLHCGPNGAGHFVKMVHNGIEYGMMAAYAEGLNVLHHANARQREAEEHSAEDHAARPAAVLPVRPRHRQGRRGVAARLGRRVLAARPDRGARCAPTRTSTALAGRVSDSGEGRWTVKAAIDEGVPAPVLSAALFARFSSRGEALYADKLLSAMRKAFGGHVELPTGE